LSLIEIVQNWHLSASTKEEFARLFLAAMLVLSQNIKRADNSKDGEQGTKVREIEKH
jgi:hypothetical protein